MSKGVVDTFESVEIEQQPHRRSRDKPAPMEQLLHEKAAHHVHTASGHSSHARMHAEEAGKVHAEEHGKK
jgi:hypothetical protein